MLPRNRPAVRRSEVQLRRRSRFLLLERNLLQISTVIAQRRHAILLQFRSDIGGCDEFVVRGAPAPVQGIGSQKVFMRPNALGAHPGQGISMPHRMNAGALRRNGLGKKGRREKNESKKSQQKTEMFCMHV